MTGPCYKDRPSKAGSGLVGPSRVGGGALGFFQMTRRLGPSYKSRPSGPGYKDRPSGAA